LVAAYLFSWSVTLIVLLLLVRRQSPAETLSRDSGNSENTSVWHTGWGYIAIGWPIVLANTGFGLMQSADRVTVNVFRPIHDFAVYSLSQSTIYVPITIIAALSRVALSYFARATDESRAGVYRASTQLITMLWIVLLPYYFVVEYVVRHFLPKYIGGLAPGRILLLSVLFLSLIQIVQLNTYNLAGRQRHFFIGSVVAVIAAFATAWTGSQIIGTLTAVAWSQVLTAALWWLGNELFLRARTGVRPKELLLVLTGFCVPAASLYAVQCLHLNLFLTTVVYLAIVVPLCCTLFWNEVKSFARVLVKAAN
jgi:O-antigen/teichoic acid export membrane protein